MSIKIKYNNVIRTIRNGKLNERIKMDLKNSTLFSGKT